MIIGRDTSLRFLFTLWKEGNTLIRMRKKEHNIKTRVPVESGIPGNEATSTQTAHNQMFYVLIFCSLLTTFSTHDAILPSNSFPSRRRCLQTKLAIFSYRIVIDLAGREPSSIYWKAPRWKRSIFCFLAQASLGVPSRVQQSHQMQSACHAFQDVLLGPQNMNFVVIHKRGELPPLLLSFH